MAEMRGEKKKNRTKQRTASWLRNIKESLPAGGLRK